MTGSAECGLDGMLLYRDQSLCTCILPHMRISLCFSVDFDNPGKEGSVAIISDEAVETERAMDLAVCHAAHWCS